MQNTMTMEDFEDMLNDHMKQSKVGKFKVKKILDNKVLVLDKRMYLMENEAGCVAVFGDECMFALPVGAFDEIEEYLKKKTITLN